ncbi:MAG: tetratricopeptide repeat protein [Nitrospirota bacterium]
MPSRSLMSTYGCAGIFAIVLISSGITLARNSDWRNGTSLWVAATAQSPGKARVFYNAGVYFHQQLQLDAALHYYSKAIELDPQKVEAFVNRGNLHDEQHRPGKASEDYDRALTIEPNNANARYNRGVLYERLGVLNAAAADYRESCIQGRPTGFRKGCESWERLSRTIMESGSPTGSRRQ